MRLWWMIGFLGLAACGKGPLSGVWLISGDAVTFDCEPWDSEDNLLPPLSYAPNNSEWTERFLEYDVNSQFLVSISYDVAGGLTWLEGSSALQGEEVDDNSYRFEFAQSSVELTSMEHEGGYFYFDELVTDREATYTLAETSFGILEGEYSLTYRVYSTKSESDTWGNAVGFDTGQLLAPSSGDGFNRRGAEDCSDDVCFANAERLCTGSTLVTGRLLGVDEEDVGGIGLGD